MLSDLSFFFFSLIVLWLGAGLIVYSLERISKRLEISTFAASFFILGFLTSLPELSVGINSILEKRPEIYVGNLIGGSVIIFLMIIPMLAILGKGIILSHQLNTPRLIFSLYVIGLPALLIIDKNLTIVESLLLITVFPILFYSMEKRKGLLDHFRDKFISHKKETLRDFFKIVVGAYIVFMSSSILVDKTVIFANNLGISTFILGLLGLSIGTNLPEISIALRSITTGKKEIALGDYIGSAATNSVLLGILTVINGKKVVLENHFLITFIFTVCGLSLFYYFTRSKNDISRKEGFILFIIYILFFIMELA
ncbi:hypothetical protein A3D78_04720 [Candidatus Gottesmanbacteria bacterium RIFCSPHIGHO2_02_FULL_39_14]|uniref:Sodium/calcium exchanger membrane region domain-containing protein n=2 Tax=Candidatus Gottesmaniibacteriota TaxID=1752720 RepID=A0A1F5ZUN1_9BACT|nr:MAG: hypothetical protein A3D78_04720 [Candidatus Gottesmanbacteria bacterium RIFCSPHIGHO2_02_FULL_39_14]OGG30960.1 MAG: hypothetical protein A3I51_02230 [Candidatus Gottesmanbacteria bacterium RIFCSPLOWO2_02_FULL_38_8]